MSAFRRSSFAAFPVTSGILLLIVLTFGVEVLAGGTDDAQVLLRLGANFPPYILELGQWWRLLTSALIHIGLLHLAVNAWALWQLGRLSEMSFGPHLTLVLFVFTALTGSALTLLTVKISAGASGALFGLEGALVAFFLRHRERLTHAGKQLLGQLLLWSALMLVFSFSAPGIDWLAHVGGFAGGLLVGWALPPRGIRPVGSGQRAAAGLAGALLILAFLQIVRGL